MLSKMFLAGAKNLENKKEWINELNVFPVPDGDTGTNMTMTIMSAAREVSALGDDADMAALCKGNSTFEYASSCFMFSDGKQRVETVCLYIRQECSSVLPLYWL